MHVTNVHDSMEEQDILKFVKSIENDKEKQKQKKKLQQKSRKKELFYRFKSKWVCSGICTQSVLRTAQSVKK